MSNDELSDEMRELEDLIAEYKTRENQKSTKRKEKKSAPKLDKAERIVLEVPMDKVLFGDKTGLIKNMALGVEGVQKEDPDKKFPKRKAVWCDDEDELKIGDIKRTTMCNKHIKMDKPYKEYLKSQFERIVSQPKWADLDVQNTNNNNNSDDEKLLRSVGFLSNNASVKKLPPSFLSYKNVRDLNRASYAEGCIASVQFHPISTTALVAGESGVASIYALDGYRNNKLHSIYFENFPIQCTRITTCGSKAFFTANKKYYFSYDLLVGKETRFNLMKNINFINRFEVSPCSRYLAFPTSFGQWHLIDAMSNELVHTFQQEHPVANLIFGDSNRVICTSATSEVYIYSLKQRRLEHKFFDEGCIKGHALDLSPNQHLLATGSTEGAVNVYDYESILTTATPKPDKTFLNLKTGISSIKFNHTSELLAMSSSMVPSAVRVAHFPSATVYANFPKERDDLGKIGTVVFSPQSGYLAMGGYDKKIKLFRIKHYKNY